MSIDKKIRMDVYERDDYTCQICFRKIILTKDIKTNDDFKLEASLDHITPKSKGGGGAEENLRTVCRSCNSRKGDVEGDDELKFLSLNKGSWTRIHNCILYALARTKLNSQESRILFAIIAKTYGFRKSDDWISNSQLEKITGIHRCHCSNTIACLVKRNLVTRSGNKTKLNKYFFSWKSKNEMLPKQVTSKTGLPKQVQNVTQTGILPLPKQVTTKEILTKEYIKKERKPFFHQALKTPKIADLFKDFEEMRNKKKKPLTDRARKIILDKLKNNSMENAVIMLEKAIENSWSSVYDLKGGDE